MEKEVAKEVAAQCARPSIEKDDSPLNEIRNHAFGKPSTISCRPIEINDRAYLDCTTTITDKNGKQLQYESLYGMTPHPMPFVKHDTDSSISGKK